MSHHTHSNNPSLLSCFKSYFALKFVMFHHFADEAELFMLYHIGYFCMPWLKIGPKQQAVPFQNGKRS